MPRRILFSALPLLILLSLTAAFSQVSNPSIILVTTAPTGSCAGLPNRQVISTGTQYSCQGGTWGAIGGSGGSGTVTNVSGLTPLFTVATPTTTPTFTLSPAAANSIFGNFTGASAAPSFSTTPVFSAANLTNFPIFNQSTTGNAATATNFQTQVTGMVKGNGASAPSAAINGVDYAPTAILPAALAIYRLTEDTGTTLNDSSGNGNTATLPGTTPPTWVSGGLRFTSGTTTPVALPAALNTARTVDVCFLRITTAGTPQYLVPLGHTAQFGAGILMGFTFATGDTAPATAASNYVSQFNNNSSVIGSGSTAAASPMCIATVLDATASVTYLNGVPVTLNGTALAAATLPSTGNYEIGGDSGPGCTSRGICDFGGTVYTVKEYTGELTASQVSTLYQSDLADMESKGIAVPGIVNPFVTVTANQVVVAGDSIPRGQGVTTPWPNNLIANLNTTYVMHNQSVACKTAALAINSIVNDDSSFVAPQGRNNLIIDMGTNDASSNACPLSANSPTAAFANIQATVNKAASLGWNHIYVMTMLSRTTADANKNTLNGLERTQLTGATLIDQAAIALLGADGASANATYFQDGIHPTQTGQNLIYPVVANAMNYWDGATALAPHTATSTTYAMVAADRFLNYSPAGTATPTLPACTGLTGYEFTINNFSQFPATFTGVNSEAIQGNAVVAPNSTSVFRCSLLSASTGGGFWIVTSNTPNSPGSQAVTLTPVTGATVVCSSATCTNSRGSLTVTGGTATTGTITTVNFSSTLTSVPVCTVVQNGSGSTGTASFDLGHTQTTGTLTINAGLTVLSATVNIDYVCQF